MNQKDIVMMEVLKITGGKPLCGVVEIPGSKNAALAILSAVILAKGKSTLHNVPKVRDIQIKLKLIEKFGATVEWNGDALTIDATNLEMNEVGEELVRPIRTSFYLLGSLLARLKHARLPAPGGCKIGDRPVDYHLKGLTLMGAEVSLESGSFVAKADKLVGAEIYFDFPSAGATQHLMATACLAEGNTVIRNAAIEPEITTLASFLKQMGAQIEGEGTSMITIKGVSELKGCNFRIPADRIQAATYLLCGAFEGGDIKATGILPEEQNALINKLREAEAQVDVGEDWVRVFSNNRLNGIRLKTMPYPGFPTDIQQPMATVLALASGSSSIEETIYESRSGHISELNLMGANIRHTGRTSGIEGVVSLQGTLVEASDLRAGAALVLAGLVAKGETIIKNVHYIDRGYESLEERITLLGGNIVRMTSAEWESSH